MVRHRRYAPTPHSFRYPAYWLYLDLSEIEEVFRTGWIWSARNPALVRFRDADHLRQLRAEQPGLSLDAAVRQLVETCTSTRLAGPIRLLTNLGHFGFRLNPVSFYFCFDPSDSEVRVVVAEVNNTPWGEQHCYVLSDAEGVQTGSVRRYRNPKEFHVSPFMDMALEYRWTIRGPGQRLLVHIENYESDRRLFDASLFARRTELTPGSMTRVLWQYPLMTWQVFSAIYWQALRLWLKKTPYFPHPAPVTTAPPT